jgi:hypothetical protein
MNCILDAANLNNKSAQFVLQSGRSANVSMSEAKDSAGSSSTAAVDELGDPDVKVCEQPLQQCAFLLHYSMLLHTVACAYSWAQPPPNRALATLSPACTVQC